MTAHDDRFLGYRQLVGESAFARTSGASVCIVGLGGVGSWAAEALARSGVGRLALVDLDEVCVTNINRQAQALSSTVGTFKAEALKERLCDISPTLSCESVRKFFSRSTAGEILAPPYDLVIDAIDRVENKAFLIAECVRLGLPVVTSSSAGDRLSPEGAVVVDLARTIHDPMLQIVRKELRAKFGFPKGEGAKFHIPCVQIPKQRRAARSVECPAGQRSRSSCNDGLGSAAFVTGAVGFMLASVAARILAEGRAQHPYPWRRHAVPEGTLIGERGSHPHPLVETV